jgi:hypothetical protein
LKVRALPGVFFTQNTDILSVFAWTLPGDGPPGWRPLIAHP